MDRESLLIIYSLIAVRIFILYYKSLSIKIEGIDDKLTIGCGPQTKILNFDN